MRYIILSLALFFAASLTTTVDEDYALKKGEKDPVEYALHKGCSDSDNYCETDGRF